MNIPQIISIDKALEIYYKFSELSKKEMEELFGKLSTARVTALKKSAQRKMMEKNIYAYGLNKISTECAFEAWGLDIVDLEKRRKKLIELGI